MAKQQKGKGSGKPPTRAPPVSDARFARVHTDPRFRQPKHDDSKITLDERFRDVLRPSGKGADALPIDRFGRRKDRMASAPEQEDLRRIYRMDDSESDTTEAESDEEAPRVDLARGEGDLESSSEEEEEEDEEDEDEDEDGDVVIGRRDAVRRAQQQGLDEVDLDEDEGLDLNAVQELDRQAQASQKQERDVERGDDTRRLAVVNMDWDHVHARDLFKVFSSIVSPSATRDPLAPAEVPEGKRGGAHMALSRVRGQVLSVRVYPSDFGKERMAQEDRYGPPREIFKDSQSGPLARDEEEDEDDPRALFQVDEGGEFDEDALRKYQLERLRYYYAVATFDSKASARHVYNEVDGTEMERSANMFDLRFVPDDMEFPDGQEGREAGFRDEATSDEGPYHGLDFKTDALRHSRVRLTWDQDDPERARVTRRKGEEMNEDDLKTYLASSSEEEEEGDPAPSRDRLRSLLGGGKNSAFEDAEDEDSPYGKDSGDMQITFTPALSDGARTKPAGEEREETTIEKYMRKQREKRERKKQRKAEREAQRNGTAEDAERPEEPPQDAKAIAEAGFDDPFFADEPDFEQAYEEEFGDKAGKSKDRKERKERKERKTKDAPAEEPPAEPPAEAEGEESDQEKHFDLTDILRAEKHKNKKMNKYQKKREAKRDAKRSSLLQPTFQMDTEDPRFRAVMEDHRFAIDPNHPSFLRTEGMKKLLDTRNQRQQQKHAAPAPTGQDPSDLRSLVSSVKRHAAQPAQRTKKARAT